MTSRSHLGFIVVLSLVLAAGAGGGMAQWRETVALQTRIEVLKAASGQLARLQEENQRLRAHPVSEAELASLRADHAALLRLRAEIEALRKRL